MDEDKLLERITVNPAIFGGKPIVRGRRLAVEHVLAMLAAGDNIETICQGYPWLEPDAIRLVTPAWRAVVSNRVLYRVARKVFADLLPVWGGILARSRYAEDQLEKAAAAGVDQYVMIGAGLDSFAHCADGIWLPD